MIHGPSRSEHDNKHTNENTHTGIKHDESPLKNITRREQQQQNEERLHDNKTEKPAHSGILPLVERGLLGERGRAYRYPSHHLLLKAMVILHQTWMAQCLAGRRRIEVHVSIYGNNRADVTEACKSRKTFISFSIWACSRSCLLSRLGSWLGLGSGWRSGQG